VALTAVVCRLEDLNRLYSLFQRVEGAVEEMKVSFNSFIKRKGTEIVVDQNRDKEMIDDLLAFKAKCDTLLERAFMRNDQYVYSLKDAFETIVNARQVRNRQRLAHDHRPCVISLVRRQRGLLQ
jgi:cullin 4